MAYMSSNHSASDMGSISFFVVPREKVFSPALTGLSLPVIVDVKSNLDRNRIVIPYPVYLCDPFDTIIFLIVFFLPLAVLCFLHRLSHSQESKRNIVID